MFCPCSHVLLTCVGPLLAGETRFGTNFYMLESVQKCKEALATMLIDPAYQKWVSDNPKYKDQANAVRHCILLVVCQGWLPGPARFLASAPTRVTRQRLQEYSLPSRVVPNSFSPLPLFALAHPVQIKRTLMDGGLAHRMDVLLKATTPFIELLRLADSPAATASKIQMRCSALLTHLEEGDHGLTPKQANEFITIFKDRWAMLHSPLYEAAMCLDPEYWDNDVAAGQEGLVTMVSKLLPPEEQQQAIEEYMKFRAKDAIFSQPLVQRAAKTVPAHKWWTSWGNHLPAIQKVAVKVRLVLWCCWF